MGATWNKIQQQRTNNNNNEHQEKKKKILFIELNIFSLSCHFCMFFKALLQKVLQGR